jgi:hypothetical protein
LYSHRVWANDREGSQEEALSVDFGSRTKRVSEQTDAIGDRGRVQQDAEGAGHPPGCADPIEERIPLRRNLRFVGNLLDAGHGAILEGRPMT